MGEPDTSTVNPWEVTAETEKGVDYDKLIGKLIFMQASLFWRDFLPLFPNFKKSRIFFWADFRLFDELSRIQI